MLGNFLWTKLQKSSPLSCCFRVSYRFSPCECYFKPQTREFLGALEFSVDVDEFVHGGSSREGLPSFGTTAAGGKWVAF